MLTAVAKKNYRQIGKILFMTHPELATRLENSLKPGEESDTGRIFLFYSRFDDLELPGYQKTHRRRLFLACMISLYYPHFFNSQYIRAGNFFAGNIAICFNCNQAQISRNIREAIVMYQAYEDFEEKVNEVVLYLKMQQP